ncbi:MAG: SLBB domain-containing protein [Pseudomonadales bacterium]|nr:SLBB domain-containing protein [Pseudomonadales bacterium]
MMGILRILLSVLLFAPALVSAISPTPAQIEAFKNLSPEQQKQLAEQYGVALPGATVGTPTEIVSPELVEPREDSAETAIQQEASEATERVTLEEDKQVLSTDQELRQFGYDLFAGTPTTFAPATDIPVPVDYVVGPGDSLVVQLYGKDNAVYDLLVSREGVIQFPEIGPMAVAGLSFQELKAKLTDVVSRQMIGVKASITMGALRSIRIFILGEAFRPGSYTVSSLSTMTNALFVSGGIKKIGSLRKVQLKRKGVLIGELDLYDLLLKGDTSNDMRMQPGDVIFIPSIGPTVGVSGEVKRPAIYELKGSQTAGELLSLAGGYLPSAYPNDSRIERINSRGNRTVVDLNLTTQRGKATKVQNGDVIQVFSVLDKMEDVVLLSGHVHRPGGFSWRPGLRFSEVLGSYDSLLPNADLDYALIKRETLPSRRVSIHKFSIADALADPLGSSDPVLEARDEILVFGVEESRGEQLADIITRLKSQADYSNPANIVEVIGNVRFAAQYPYHAGMTITDLVDASSGLLENSDLNYSLLVREQVNQATIAVEAIQLNRQADLNKKLNPKDKLFVFDLSSDRQETIMPILDQLSMQTQKESELKIVSVSGLVRFPGDYPLTNNMSVSSLIEAAGGYQESAYTIGAEITRSMIVDEQEREFFRIDVDLNLDSSNQLLSRDQLYIKRIPNWTGRESATISGEVKFPGTYPIFKGDTIVDLVRRAGGLTDYGDANAAVFLREDLKKREQQQLLKFRAQLEKDLAELKLEAAKDKSKKLDAAMVGESMLEQLAKARATGRLVIDLDRILLDDSDKSNSIKLKDNDLLVIPSRSTEVSVLGEVQFPTSHLYEDGHNVFDYVDVSGGFTSKSDDDRIYIIKPNGKIVAVKNGWFVNRNDSVGPGDTVVVPYDTDSVSPITYWVSVSQILFQLATTVAALDSVGVF